MRYIVWSIQNNAALPLPSMQELSYKIAPYIERAGDEVAKYLPSPRTLNVHFPYEFTPYHSKARYIYVARDPRDTCVSFYHMTRESLGGSGYLNATFSEYFELFITGNIPYGDYFDHLLAWYKHRDTNVLFLTYEEMLLDTKKAVLQVARFISDSEHDYEKLLTANDCLLLDRITENTTFDNMKDMPVVIKNAAETSCGDALLDAGVRVNFFRKGKAGDWINYFNKDQVRRLHERMMKKVTGTGIERLWSFSES